MAKPVQVGDIRAILSDALDGASCRKKKKGPAAVSSSGNVMNVRLPGVRCSSENCHCGSALRVTLATICGFGIASFIFGVTVITLKFLL